MAVPSFAALAPSYARLWADLAPLPEHMPALRTICQKLLAHKATYQAVSQTVWGTPDHWWYVAITDQMEGGGGANTYLGNGQSLHRPTTEVPSGRGPFASFHDGAVDALRGSGDPRKAVAEPTTIERAAFNWEGYNGWGYLNKPIVDPYLAAQSNEYTSGKYIADHDYDANAVSQQPGALTILKVLIALDPTLFATAALPAPEPAPQPEIPPVTATAPVAPVLIDYTQLAAALLAAQPNLVAPPRPAAPLVVAPVAPMPQIDLASMLAHLDVLLPVATIILSAIPAAAPFAPLLTVVQRALHAIADVTSTMQTNPAALPDALGGHIAAVAPLLDQLKTVFPAMPWLTTIETVVGNIAKALPAPAVPTKGTSP